MTRPPVFSQTTVRVVFNKNILKNKKSLKYGTFLYITCFRKAYVQFLRTRPQ